MSFDFATVQKATNNFSYENKLGEGRIGSVYKGRLPDGQEVAVQRLYGLSHQELTNEVLLLSELQHSNLVRLLSSCLEGDERLLVYEFFPNASLDRFIFDPIKRSELDWERCYKILIGVARGLLYLHDESHLPIIHCDLQPCNILLDQDMNPKIAGFSLARLLPINETHHSTISSSSTALARFLLSGNVVPEYLMQRHCSVKTDVFAFGVLLLEIISGQKNSSFRDEDNFVGIISHAWNHWWEGTWLDLIDPILRSNGSSSTTEMKKCIHIGLLCVQNHAADRPTMASVVRMLCGDSTALPTPLIRHSICIRQSLPNLSRHILKSILSRSFHSTTLKPSKKQLITSTVQTN